MTAAYDYVISELTRMSGEVCRSCSGFGHTLERCPTEEKLTVFSATGGEHQNIITRARDLVESGVGHGL